jgi:cyclic pyranopterin phosphate synthase
MVDHPSQRLTDSFGRRFSYLRLSITDACNFRCTYCLPHGYQGHQGKKESYLSVREIQNLISAFAELGTWKVRLTGGEPVLRGDLLEIVEGISKTPGISKVALSTNGHRLKVLAPAFAQAGITGLNVSVDSLNAERFYQSTGKDRLGEVLEGIEIAQKVGFTHIKVNTVLMKTSSEEEFSLFQEWIRDRPITVRFIELMPTGQNTSFFRDQHLRSERILDKILAAGWRPKARGEADGPAVEFTHPKFLGKFGIIAPYSKDFCSTCNRLRVTSHGALRLCLFGDGNHSIRHLLQHESQREELKQTVSSLLQAKEISHYLPESKIGNNQTFSAMGG